MQASFRPSLSRLAAVAVVVAFANDASARQYTITDIGLEKSPLAINQDGQIAGQHHENAMIDRHGRWRALDLHPSIALGIDDEGDAVGQVGRDAVLWARAAQGVTLPMPGPSRIASAHGINGNRTVVGSFEDDTDRLAHCFAWREDRGSVDLGFMAQGDRCEALAINANGRVTGGSSVQQEGDEHAFLYDEQQGFTDLGVLPGGTYSVGLALNRFGAVVGRADFGPDHPGDHAFLYVNGVMHDLDPNRVYASTSAEAINNRGDIVGYAIDHREKRQVAIRFDLNLVPLEDELVDRGDWQLLEATAVSDNGQVVGEGMRSDGRLHAFLLTPTGK